MAHLIIKLLLFGFLIFFSGCARSQPESISKPIEHATWTHLLQDHVDENGMVNYAKWINDTSRLNEYLTLVKTHHPNDKYWNQSEQLAYWINAYNAFTVQLVLRHYPIESIKDISAINIPLVYSPWDIDFISIEGNKYDLNDIEHGIIREQFNEPRIHFALVCAAQSCPKLRNEAYKAVQLEAQLTDQAKAFINDASKNKIEKNNFRLSKLFLWYRGDFTKSGSLIEFLNQYSDVKIDESANSGYMDYNWQLNQKN
ncbi:MAG: DUF547 domain-containing protein [Salibacteraceae bacterium]